MKLENLPPAAPSIKTVSKKRWRAPVIAVAALAIGGAGWYAMQAPKPGAAPGRDLLKGRLDHRPVGIVRHQGGNRAPVLGDRVGKRAIDVGFRNVIPAA